MPAATAAAATAAAATAAAATAAAGAAAEKAQTQGLCWPYEVYRQLRRRGEPAPYLRELDAPPAAES